MSSSAQSTARLQALGIRVFEANEVERLTHGQVAFKVFFGGIAGNEIEVQERVRRGQVRGVRADAGGVQHADDAPLLAPQHL